MKNFFFAVALCAYALVCRGQESTLPKYENDTLYSTSGFKITPEQKIKLGTGSTPDGSFKFVRINSNSFFSYSSDKPNDANNANAGPRSMSGHEYKVAKIDKRGTRKTGYVYYAVLAGLPRYEIDVDNAIAVGEIVVPSEYKPGAKSQPASTMSLADELKKLKDLLDQGALTKDEFESAKKKLLSQ